MMENNQVWEVMGWSLYRKEKSMNAFHSNWTKPFFARHSGEYYIEDFELLTTILSALKWQQFNGDIKMVTDLIGYEYYQRLGITSVWNAGIDYSLEKAVSIDIDPYTFWAAGKLYALRQEHGPCVMLDTDFIIWESLTEELIKHELTVIHREDITEAVYPGPDKFILNDTYEINQSFDWGVLPCNTAFTFINNEQFKEEYTRCAMEFMKNTKARDPLIYMVFAEQRLIAMCAEKNDIDIYSFSDVNTLFHSSQKTFTHIWGHKSYLQSHPEERERFCKRCMLRILRDFPYMLDTLLGVKELNKYIDPEMIHEIELSQA